MFFFPGITSILCVTCNTFLFDLIVLYAISVHLSSWFCTYVVKLMVMLSQSVLSICNCFHNLQCIKLSHPSYMLHKNTVQQNHITMTISIQILRSLECLRKSVNILTGLLTKTSFVTEILAILLLRRPLTMPALLVYTEPTKWA